jgi:methylphosphotriester-DNA--protein-cysteine methyltransferase
MTVFADVSKLSTDEFQRAVGVSLDIFLSICTTVSDIIAKEREEKPMRKRGKQTGISIENQVLIFFYYIRDYPTFLKLGQQFKISESYTHRIYHRILTIIVKTYKLPNRKVLLDGNHEKILINVTEQQIERPVKKQKNYYSGKKKTSH